MITLQNNSLIRMNMGENILLKIYNIDFNKGKVLIRNKSSGLIKDFDLDVVFRYVQTGLWQLV